MASWPRSMPCRVHVSAISFSASLEASASATIQPTT